MKIGILTFHWAANHGAILQGYASAHYLAALCPDSDVRIIDYVPATQETSLLNLLRPRHPRAMLARWKAYAKGRRLDAFRRRLPLTARFSSRAALKQGMGDLDLALCGSDQIWNPAFTLHGEGGPTAVYFLDFCSERCTKASLSVSFGCSAFPPEAAAVAHDAIADLYALSVREEDGATILKDMGFENARVVADPTALLTTADYKDLCKDIPPARNRFAAVCILRKQNAETTALIERVKRAAGVPAKDIEQLSMDEWLAGIRDAERVITNSFHCTMMCLKLHTPFTVILEKNKNSGMNGRFFTLLRRFGLENTIADSDRPVENTFFTPDWDAVDAEMERYAATLKEYLTEVTEKAYESL